MATSPAATKLPNNVIQLLEGDEKWGDTIMIGNSLIGGDDQFIGAASASGGYTGYGDAEAIFGNGKGGNDRFIGGNQAGTPGVSYFPFLPASFESDELSILQVSGGGTPPGPVLFVGDASYMAEMAVGGNDTMTGGTNSGNVFVGDALELQLDSARGGNDSLRGGNALGDWGSSGSASSMMLGDSGEMEGNATGGVDTIIGGNATGLRGGGAFALNMAAGDGGTMSGNSVGAADRLTGGNASASTDGDAAVLNLLVGDGLMMGGDARGGADIMVGGNLSVAFTASGDSDGYAINAMAGDAMYMYDDAVAGNDVMTGGIMTVTGTDGDSGDGYSGMMNLFAGDTFYLEDAASLGNDKLTGTSVASGVDGYALNVLAGDWLDIGMDMIPTSGDFGFGDLSSLSGPGTFVDIPSESGDYDLQFGNDTLIGGNGQAFNLLVGDGYSMGPWDIGGNDRLQGGSGVSENYLIGDAFMAYGTQGGNDTLISSTGDDDMYGDFVSGDGDGGADRFVFAPGNGDDVIYDFEAGIDKIDLYALRANNQLRDWAGVSSRIDDSNEGYVVLHLDTFAPSPNNTVTIVGIEDKNELSGSFIYSLYGV
jgi:hypothetical protein